MEFTGNMPGLQRKKGYDFRFGQRLAYETALRTVKIASLFVLPTGYGKTDTAYGFFAIMRHRKIVDRMLVFVPTDQQRKQFVKSCKKAASNLGIENINAMAVEKNPVEFRYNHNDTYNVFVASYQQSMEVSFFKELTSYGNWLIVCDEAHHLAFDGKWGNSVDQIKREFALFLSATPIRSDRKLLKGVPSKTTNEGIIYDADIEVTFKSALAEGAIRRPFGHIHHYFVDVMIDGINEVKRVDTDMLKQEGVVDFSQYEAKYALRYCDKYISKIFIDALRCLESKNLRHTRQHQMLVFCMTQAHAKHVSKVFNRLESAGKEKSEQTKFSDWIGESRGKEVNKAILEEYKNGKIKCLVQVEMAGEGFDHDKCSTLVFLNLTKSDPKIKQQVGRGLRRNYNIDFSEDICDIFASSDTDIAELVRNLEIDSSTILKDSVGPGPGPGPWLTDIPDLSVVNAKFIKNEDVIPEVYKQYYDEQISKIASLSKEFGLNNSDPTKLKSFIDAVNGRNPNPIHERYLFDIDSGDEVGRREYYSQKVKQAISTVVSNVIELKGNGSFEQSLKGDLYAAIHGKWKIENKFTNLKNAHKGMTSDDFRNKYAWLKQLNDHIRSYQEVPIWLNL